MDTNKMRDPVREQFEAWMHREFAWPIGLLSLAWDESTGTYKEANFHIGWTAWKASRAAVVVELPSAIESPPYACFQSGWNDMRGEAVDAIEAQGLRVAP